MTKLSISAMGKCGWGKCIFWSNTFIYHGGLNISCLNPLRLLSGFNKVCGMLGTWWVPGKQQTPLCLYVSVHFMESPPPGLFAILISFPFFQGSTFVWPQRKSSHLGVKVYQASHTGPHPTPTTTFFYLTHISLLSFLAEMRLLATKMEINEVSILIYIFQTLCYECVSFSKEGKRNYNKDNLIQVTQLGPSRYFQAQQGPSVDNSCGLCQVAPSRKP